MMRTRSRKKKKKIRASDGQTAGRVFSTSEAPWRIVLRFAAIGPLSLVGCTSYNLTVSVCVLLGEKGGKNVEENQMMASLKLMASTHSSSEQKEDITRTGSRTTLSHKQTCKSIGLTCAFDICLWTFLLPPIYVYE